MRLKAFAIFAETLRPLRLKKAGFYNFLKLHPKRFYKIISALVA
jgi:hypothetical protein